jgi:hypothetical protein
MYVVLLQRSLIMSLNQPGENKNNAMVRLTAWLEGDRGVVLMDPPSPWSGAHRARAARELSSPLENKNNWVDSDDSDAMPELMEVDDRGPVTLPIIYDRVDSDDDDSDTMPELIDVPELYDEYGYLSATPWLFAAGHTHNQVDRIALAYAGRIARGDIEDTDTRGG